MSGSADPSELPAPRRGDPGTPALEAGAGRSDEFEVAGALLTDIVDGRKLFFDVEVTEGERTIGIGTHQRRVVAAPPAEG